MNINRSNTYSSSSRFNELMIQLKNSRISEKKIKKILDNLPHQDIDRLDNKGNPPTFYINNEAVFQLFLRKSPDLTLTNEKGNNFLHTMVKKERVKVIHYLFQNINQERCQHLLNQKNKKGKSPLLYFKNFNIFKVLIEYSTRLPLLEDNQKEYLFTRIYKFFTVDQQGEAFQIMKTKSICSAYFKQFSFAIWTLPYKGRDYFSYTFFTLANKKVFLNANKSDLSFLFDLLLKKLNEPKSQVTTSQVLVKTYCENLLPEDSQIHSLVILSKLKLSDYTVSRQLAKFQEEIVHLKALLEEKPTLNLSGIELILQIPSKPTLEESLDLAPKILTLWLQQYIKKEENRMDQKIWQLKAQAIAQIFENLGDGFCFLLKDLTFLSITNFNKSRKTRQIKIDVFTIFYFLIECNIPYSSEKLSKLASLTFHSFPRICYIQTIHYLIHKNIICLEDHLTYLIGLFEQYLIGISELVLLLRYFSTHFPQNSSGIKTQTPSTLSCRLEQTVFKLKINNKVLIKSKRPLLELREKQIPLENLSMIDLSIQEKIVHSLHQKPWIIEHVFHFLRKEEKETMEELLNTLSKSLAMPEPDLKLENWLLNKEEPSPLPQEELQEQPYRKSFASPSQRLSALKKINV